MEVINKPDWLIIEAMLCEEHIKLQIQVLTKYRKKINAILAEKQLNPTQRQNLENLLKLSRGEYINRGA